MMYKSEMGIVFMENKKKAALGIAAALLATTLTGCSGNTSKILSEIDSQNYNGAIELYYYFDLSDSEIQALSEGVLTRINEALEKYAANEIDYSEISELLEIAYDMDLDSVSTDFAVASSRLSSLYSSKQSYKYGVEYYSEGSYSSAYSYFEEVIEDDAYYSEAAEYKSKCVSEYCASVSSSVEEYTDDDDYYSAISYVTSCMNYAFCDEVSETLKATRDQLVTEYAINEAEEYVDEDDVATALERINELLEDYDVEDTTEIDEYRDSIKDEYVDMIMEKVEKLCDEENYTLALNMLANAQQIVESDEFSEAIEEINKIKPIYLYDLKYSTSDNFEVIDTGEELTDTIGNTYAVGNLFEMSAASGWSSSDGSVTYNLAYNYNTMTGVISVDDISDDATATLQILGDDVVLYSVELSRTTTPTPVTIDVSNVNWLEISLTDASGGTIYAILSDFKFDDTDSSSDQSSGSDTSESSSSSSSSDTSEESSASASTTSEASSESSSSSSSSNASEESSAVTSSASSESESTDE